MSSILLKDTTPEQRREIVQNALNEWADSGCDIADAGIDYDQYIRGEKELSQLNAEYSPNIIVAFPDDNPRQSCSI